MSSAMRLLSIVGAVAIASTAFAEDLYPPDWRGLPGTTYQHWTFEYPQGPGWYPEAYDNVWGEPYLHTDFGSEIWYPIYDNYLEHWGVIQTYDGDGILLEIPNVPQPNDLKLIWLQVTFLESFEYGGDHPLVGLADPGGYDFNQVALYPLDGDDIGWWHHAVWEAEIPFNPDHEMIVLFPFGPTGGLIIDQIVVDTWCVPAPSTMGIVVFSGLLALRRRR